MKVYCNTLNPENHKDLLEQGVEFIELDRLLAEADIISVNIPLTDKSKNLISKDKIKLMKKTATFINRGYKLNVFEEAVKIMNSYDKKFCATLVSVTTHIPFYLTGVSNLEEKVTITQDDVKEYNNKTNGKIIGKYENNTDKIYIVTANFPFSIQSPKVAPHI